MWGHALRIARNNTVIGDAKSQSLGFSLLKVVSLAPPFTFYNHGILDFKPEGSFKRSSGPVPWHNDGCFEDETVLGCPSFAICVLFWCSKPFSSWVRCSGRQRHGTGLDDGAPPREQGWVSVISSPEATLQAPRVCEDPIPLPLPCSLRKQEMHLLLRTGPRGRPPPGHSVFFLQRQTSF